MAWSGGTFSRVHDWTTDAANGVAISSTRMDAEDDNFATGINSCLHLGGTNSPTANIDWGGYKITNIASATTSSGVPSVAQVQGSSATYVASDSGSANAYAIAPSVAITSYAAGQRFQFVPANKNTGASTLAVSGLTAKNIKLMDGTDPGLNMIHTSQIADVMYNGTSFVLLNPAKPVPLGALVYNTSAQSVGSGADAQITFDAEVYDTNAFHDTGSNTTRITIPTGATYARFTATLQCTPGATADKVVKLEILKNGASDSTLGGATYSTSAASQVCSLSVVTPIVAVTATHYYEVSVFHDYGSAIDMTSAFSIEVIK